MKGINTTIKFLALLTVLVLSTSVFSTSMMMVGLEELSSDAEKILQVYVTDTEVRWNKDSTSIVTYIRANVDEDVVGEGNDNEFIIKQYGGRIGTLNLAIEGYTAYKTGDEAILFLFKDPENQACYQTMGMYQGKYKIYNENGVKKVARDNPTNVLLFKAAADGTLEPTTDTTGTYNNTELDQFKSLVRDFRSLGN